MTALEGLASPAYVFDRTGQIRWLNAAAVRILGNRVGEPYANMVAPHARHVAQAQFARKIVGEGGTVFDLDALDRDGNPITVKITSAPLRVDGAIVGVFGVAVPLPGDGAPVAESLVSKLTPRQLETLRLLADGLPTPEVAERLGVAVETARNHIRAVLRALDVHTRLEAVVKAIRTGLLA